jgi:hypothetical protein
MQPARASAIAAVVFASVGLIGSAAALAYAHADTTTSSSVESPGHGHGHGHADKKFHPKSDNGKAGKNNEKSGDPSSAGRAHADAMTAWARCVAAAASGPKADVAPVPPKTACGDKPAPPGWAKHGRDGSPGNSGHAMKPKSHGHGHSDGGSSQD